LLSRPGAADETDRPLKQIAKTFDPVRLSYLRSILNDEGIEYVVLDTAAGSIWPGAIPVRIMVEEKDAWRARCILSDAGAAEAEDEK
jgi:hypothetical protein